MSLLHNVRQFVGGSADPRIGSLAWSRETLPVLRCLNKSFLCCCGNRSILHSLQVTFLLTYGALSSRVSMLPLEVTTVPISGPAKNPKRFVAKATPRILRCSTIVGQRQPRHPRFHVSTWSYHVQEIGRSQNPSHMFRQDCSNALRAPAR